MFLRRAIPLSPCLLASLLLTGCGSGTNTPHPTPVGASHHSGSVHGGQQPVVGATIQLYTVGTTADGSAATPLLTSTVTSDSTGSFTITGLYSCTNATQVYIVATGGNPGLSTANPNIALMAALGPCSSLTSSTFISINELTTVAAVAALAPYMTSATAIGSSPSNASSLAAAFTLANEYVNTTTGLSPGNVPTGYTVPTAQLNTLADIISACINSTGGAAGDGSLCGQLFSLATIPPNPAPTSTITALLNIILDPTLNTSALFALVPPTPPFQPTLTSAPSNWQIQLIPPPGTGPVTLTSELNFTILGALEDLTLTNQGTAPVNIASILESDSAQPPATPYFTIAVNNCGTSLAAQSSCTISIDSSNSPTPVVQPVTVTGAVTVTDDAGTQTASLSSTDVYEITTSGFPAYIPSTGIVSFTPEQVGSTEAGTTATSFYYTPWNRSSIAPPIPLTLSGSNPGDFAVTSSPYPPVAGTFCSSNFAYGEQCPVTASFTPSAAGQRTAKVSLDPSFGTPTGQYILLQGTGVGSGPSFSVSANSIPLQSYLPGNIDPRSAGSATLTLTNIGTTTVGLAASFTGSAAPYLAASVSNCSSVAANATCQFTVNFNAPTTPGTLSGNLVLSDTNSTFTLTVPVTGTTAYWSAVSAPGLLTFTNQALGTTSSAQNFVIADPNGYPLGHAYTVTLQPSSNFILTQGSTCPASTTQTCTLAIAFAPQANSIVSEVATITDQTTNLQSQLGLFGKGGSIPAYTLSTTAITFPAEGTGTTNAPPISVTLTSNGTQPVAISNISIPDAVNNNFTQTNNCSTIAVNATCTVNISFAPTAAGSQSATLQIASNAPSSPTSVSLAGSASTTTGTALQISPSSLSFTVVPSTLGLASPPQSVTVTNVASYPVSINSTSISGATGATFNISSANNCVLILSPGGSCTISLTAYSQTGTGSGSLVINSSTPASPQSVVLSTSGSAGGSTATLTPASFTYTIWGANKDFTLNNTGSAPLTVGSIAGFSTGGQESSHRFSVSYNGCSTPLAGGASCTFGMESDLTMLPSTYFFNGNGGLSGLTGQIVVDDDATTGTGVQTASTISGGAYLLFNGATSGTVTFPGNQVGSTQTATLQLVNDASSSPAASLTIGGANPGDFSVSALEPSVSATPSTSCPGTGTAACAITITFKPTAVGTRTAEISLDSGSTSTGQYIYVTGTALSPGASFSTSPSGIVSLFSYLPATTDPKSTGRQTITVTNTGTTTLNLASSLTGANPSSFTADTSQCQSVAPQATCSVNLTFSGAALANYSASLFLYDTSSSASATISLTGQTNVWDPAGSLWPPLSQSGYYQFPNQQVNTLSAPVTFTVTNQNGLPLGDPISITVTSDLILPQGGYCPASTTQPCTVVVQFNPQKTGNLGDSIKFTDTVTGAINIEEFLGTGVQ
jgi:hypothetical protein